MREERAVEQLPASPYPGLAPFRDSELDALFFFGRERENEIIAANLLAARLTVLYGPSGVGKSSLLRAGVAQRLRSAAQEGVADGGPPEFVVVIFDSWSGDPGEHLAAAIVDSVRAAVGDGGWTPGNADALLDVCRACGARLGGDVILLLDQFEEYFLYHGESPTSGLGADLPDLVQRADVPVRVLIGIREDSLAKLDAFKPRIPNLFANFLRLDPLDRDAGRAAIVGPVEQYSRLGGEEHGVGIEPALAEAVLDGVAAGEIAYAVPGRGTVDQEPSKEWVEAPYLQLVMERIWQEEREQGSHLLRLATLEELGGAGRIVEAHLERALQGLSPDELDAASEMFTHLVTPSGSKIAHEASDLAAFAAVEREQAREVLERLAAERILRPLSRNGGGTRYEIYHDVLAAAVLDWRARNAVERERRQAQRRLRRALLAAGASIAALAIVAAVALFALHQRAVARTSARSAHARELSARATTELSADPLRSIALALQATRLDPSAEAEDVLRKSLLASHVRSILPAGREPVSAAAYSPDGSRVVTADEDGSVKIFRPDGSVVAVLPHNTGVNDASFSPDGRFVATGSRGRTVRLWTAGGRPLRTLAVAAPVRQVRFSPDSRFLIAISADATLRVWTTRGAAVYTVREPEAARAFAVSADGRWVVTFGADRFARVYDLRSGRLVYALAHQGLVRSAAFGRTSRLLLTGSADRKARAWDLRQGTLVHEFGSGRLRPGSRGQLLDIAAAPRGRLLATASADGTARIWDVSKGALVTVLFGHTNYVDDVSFSPDQRFVVTSSRDGTARVWRVGGYPLAVLAGHEGAVQGATFSPNGKRVVTFSKDGTARIWDPGIAPDLRLLGRHVGPATSLDLRADGKAAVSAGPDGTARIWRLDGGPGVTLRHRAAVTDASFSPDGKLVVTASRDHSVRVWSAAGTLLRTLGHPAEVLAVAVAPDSRLVAGAGADGSVRIWTLPAGELERTLMHPGAVQRLAFRPDGKQLATAAGDSVRLWRVADGKLERSLRGHRGPIASLSFSADGRHLVTASRDRTARIWNTSSGQVEQVLRGHTNAVTSAVFSPDGKLVVTSSLDHDARLWDVRTGESRVLRGHFAFVSEARFSPDGRWVVTAGPGDAGLWYTATGRMLLRLRGHVGPLKHALFTPDGTRIVTAGEDGTVRLYRCEICGTARELEQVAEARLAVTRR
jgi:WD40 repeat protein